MVVYFESEEESSLEFESTSSSEVSSEAAAPVENDIYIQSFLSEASSEAYTAEDLNYDLILGVVFGFFIVLKLMKFIQRALFVRFDSSAVKKKDL